MNTPSCPGRKFIDGRFVGFGGEKRLKARDQSGAWPGLDEVIAPACPCEEQKSRSNLPVDPLARSGSLGTARSNRRCAPPENKLNYKLIGRILVRLSWVLGAILCLSATGYSATADAPSLAKGTVTAEQMPSTALGEPLNFLVYLPAAYTDAQRERFPVVYLLHGRGDSMAAWRTIVPDLDRLIAEEKIPPVIAVLPDAPSSSRAGYYIDSQFSDGKAVESALINDLIPGIDARYRTVTSRAGRIVAGYSMGGYGALRYSLVRPDLFGAAIVLSPAVYFPLPPRASSTREFGAFGRGQVLFDERIYQSKNYPSLLLAYRKKNLPLVLFIAVGDDENPLSDVSEASHDLDYEAHTLYNMIRRVPPISAQLRVLDGGHNWSVWRPGFIEGITTILGKPPTTK